jgi:hypothetical protein
MTKIKTRIWVGLDGSLSGRALGLPAGEHDAEIAVPEVTGEPARLDAARLLDRIRAIQEEIAQLPVLDPRGPDDIIGYNEHGHLG